MGRRVGSDPVSTTGIVVLRIVATSQTVSVVTARLIQMGCRDALPRSLPMAHRNPPVPTQDTTWRKDFELIFERTATRDS
jgi:hypothetical protein